MYLSDGQCLCPSQTRTLACSRIQRSSFGLFFSAVHLCQPNLIKEEQISPALDPKWPPKWPREIRNVDSGTVLFSCPNPFKRNLGFSSRGSQSFKVYVSDFHPLTNNPRQSWYVEVTGRRRPRPLLSPSLLWEEPAFWERRLLAWEEVLAVHDCKGSFPNEHTVETPDKYRQSLYLSTENVTLSSRNRLWEVGIFLIFELLLDTLLEKMSSNGRWQAQTAHLPDLQDPDADFPPEHPGRDGVFLWVHFLQVVKGTPNRHCRLLKITSLGPSKMITMKTEWIFPKAKCIWLVHDFPLSFEGLFEGVIIARSNFLMTLFNKWNVSSPMWAP